LNSKDPVPAAGHHGIQNSVVAAIDISAFTDLHVYKKNVDLFIKAIKSLPKADSYEEILVPGEPEETAYRKRIEYGIPLPPGTVNKLHQVSKEFDVPLPTFI
jgi:LDH2 family malate/lactate/ureidoglycolate dehydrogenase